MILKEYIEQLQNIVKENPKYANLVVAYSSDDEGNSYHKITSEIGSPCQVENTEDYYLEMVGYQGDEDISDEDINCIIIN